jgi:hypothetical protein
MRRLGNFLAELKRRKRTEGGPEAHPACRGNFFSLAEDFCCMLTPMNTCPCIASLKTLITTGKWEGGGCECGKKIPTTHLLIAGVAGLLLAVLVGGLVSRRR